MNLKLKNRPKRTAAVPAGKSALLSDALRGQLKASSARWSDVTLVSIVDESLPKSVELRDFLLDVAELGDKLHLELYNKGKIRKSKKKINADKFPVVSLLNSIVNTVASNTTVPGGHELNSFILAIYNLADLVKHWIQSY
jgi:thioredoxin reductase (NADPH)